TGAYGWADGTGTTATFSTPCGITGDGLGNLYVADLGNNEIRKIIIATRAVSTLAGSTAAGSANGPGPAARFSAPVGIVYNPSDFALYVTAYSNNQIRRVTTTGVVSLFAGSPTGVAGNTDATGLAATFNAPTGIAIGSAGLFVEDRGTGHI